MRTIRHHVLTIAIGLASVLAPGLASGTAEAQDTAPHRVAVVDVAYIFKNHPGIKSQVAKVEGELKAFDAEMKQTREELKTMAAKLKGLNAGSPEYAELEEKFAGMESKMRLDMARKRKELADAEAKIYYDNYLHIANGVKLIAKHNKINLVLRYNSENMNQSEGQSVIRGVMKNIVYHDDTLDMTPTVMQYLNGVLKNGIASGESPATRR